MAAAVVSSAVKAMLSLSRQVCVIGHIISSSACRAHRLRQDNRDEHPGDIECAAELLAEVLELRKEPYVATFDAPCAAQNLFSRCGGDAGPDEVRRTLGGRSTYTQLRPTSVISCVAIESAKRDEAWKSTGLGHQPQDRPEHRKHRVREARRSMEVYRTGSSTSRPA